PQQEDLSDSPSESQDSSLYGNTDDHDRQSDAQSAGGGGDGGPTSCDPSLSRNLSSSKLNAKAPEFVPRSSSSSPSTSSSAVARTDLTQSRLVLPQPPPPGLVHVYAAPNSSFSVPIASHVPVSVPVQNHHRPYAQHVPVQYHHHPHHHHHRQYYAGGVGGFVDHQEVAVQATQQHAPMVDSDHVASLKNGLSEEATLKILNQARPSFYFVYFLCQILFA
ncbi:unnamed protein product, partial [Ilex paraguariensis]